MAQNFAAPSTPAHGDVDGLSEAVVHPNTAVSSDSDYLSEADCGDGGVPDDGPAARFGSLLSSWREAPASICKDGAVSDGLCADVLEHYNGYGDADAASSLYADEGSLPEESLFDQAGLQQLFYFVCTAGGVGHSRKDTKSFYHATVAYELLELLPSRIECLSPCGLNIVVGQIFVLYRPLKALASTESVLIWALTIDAPRSLADG